MNLHAACPPTSLGVMSWNRSEAIGTKLRINENPNLDLDLHRMGMPKKSRHSPLAVGRKLLVFRTRINSSLNIICISSQTIIMHCTFLTFSFGTVLGSSISKWARCGGGRICLVVIGPQMTMFNKPIVTIHGGSSMSIHIQLYSSFSVFHLAAYFLGILYPANTFAIVPFCTSVPSPLPAPIIVPLPVEFLPS